jgi:hypothetical protein
MRVRIRRFDEAELPSARVSFDPCHLESLDDPAYRV